MSSILIDNSLEGRSISNSNPHVQSFLQSHQIQTYDQLSEDQLRLLFNEDAENFWSVIRVFGLLGVRYKGKLEAYSSYEFGKGDFLVYQGKLPGDTEVTYSFKLERFLRTFLSSFGLKTISDIHGLYLLNVQHQLDKLNLSEWYGAFVEELLQQQFVIRRELGEPQTEAGVHSGADESFTKTVTFENAVIRIPNIMLARDIAPDFSGSVARNIHCLLEDGLTTYGQLPDNLKDYFLHQPSIGIGKINRFKNELLNNIEMYSQEPANVVLTMETPTEKPIYVPPLLRDKSVDLFLPVINRYSAYPLIVEQLSEMGIVKWGELSGFTKTELTEGLRKKHARINRILPTFAELSIHLDGEEAEVTLEGLWTQFYTDLSALAHNNRLDFLEERSWEVLYKRVNKGPYGGEMTLQEISDELQVTRERIRQIEAKAFELFILRHVPLLFELKETVSGRYNLVSVEDILGAHFTMNDAEEGVLASIVKKCDIGLLYDTEYHAFFAGNNGQVDQDIAELISYLMSEQRWYNRSRLEDKVNAYFEKNPTSLLTPDMVFETIVPSCFILFHSLYFPATGTKKDLLLPVFEAFFPEGLALIKNAHLFTDIAREMYPEYFEDNDDRSIYSSLLRNEEEIVIWDNGYYIPRSSITVEPDDLVPMKEWTIQLLKESQAPQIRLTRTLWHFREQLERLGITNEYALYTCFKLYGSNEFDFVKAPRICLKGELDAARQPLTQIFYDYIKAQNRKVSRKEIVEHFKNQLGWETYHIEQRMGDQIIRAGYDEYIHIDNLQVNLQGLESVKNWLVRKMESVESVVSIKVVNRAIMKLANIDSYQTLYYMLEREYPDEFSFYIYPKLGLFDKEEELNAPSRRSPIALLEHYLQSGQAVAYRSELEKHFKSIGWAQINYNSRNIIVYEFKNDQALAFVHTDTIGWNEEKRDTFLSLIHGAFDELYEDNEFLLDMDLLYQKASVRQHLPRLANGIEWTPDLMVSLLKQEDERVTILGITEKTAIRDDNPHSIASELDLIHYLLVKEYQGAASIQQMERRLQELNVINRSMSRLYYNDQMDENIPYVTTPALEIMTQDLYRTRMGGG